MGEVFALQDGITVESYPFNELTGFFISGIDYRNNPFEIYLNGEIVEKLASQISEEGKSSNYGVIALSSGITSHRVQNDSLQLSGLDRKDRVFTLRVGKGEVQLLREFISMFQESSRSEK